MPSKSSRIAKFGCLGSLIIVLSAGCDMEDVGSDGGWNSSFNWVDLSGSYAGAGENGVIVGDFATEAAESAESGQGIGVAPNTVSVPSESDGTIPATQTVISGDLDQYPGITPGSVTIVMQGASSGGSFTDDGAGNLSGNFNLVGIDDPTQMGTGSINYDTGIWTLSLDEPGFLEEQTVTLSYAYRANDAVTPDTGDSDDKPNVIYEFEVFQTGNEVTITDSNGDHYSGSLGTTGLSESSGQTEEEGEVQEEISQSIQFAASGTSQGVGVEIVGVFQVTEVIYYARVSESGDDGSSTSLQEIYRLQSFTVTGTWIQDNGITGKIQGVGPSNRRVEIVRY